MHAEVLNTIFQNARAILRELIFEIRRFPIFTFFFIKIVFFAKRPRLASRGLEKLCCP